MLDGIPVYLARHPDGNYLLTKCVDGLSEISAGRIIVTICREDELKYHAAWRIAAIFREHAGVEVLVLDERPSGPADTVYAALIDKKIAGEFIVKDADSFVKIKSAASSNFVAGLRLNSFNSDLSNIMNKSFLTLNEQEQILDVIEKKITSDVVCSGLYGFQDAVDYIEAYTSLKDHNYDMQKLYVSHIISYLIGCKRSIFYHEPSLSYESWESALDWQQVWRNHSTYISCRDHSASAKRKLAIFDLDGTLVDTRVVNFKSYEAALAFENAKIEFDYFAEHCNGRHYTEFLPFILNSNDSDVVERVHDKKKALYSGFVNEAVINKHLLEIARLLRSEYHLAIVTTASAQNCMELLNALGLTNEFELILTQKDVLRPKPDPEGFKKVMRYFGVEPNDTIVFEDADVGFEAAKRAGAVCFAVIGYR
jgi:HAD superfamily hydrolase (TIGR01509 family)